MLLCNIWMLTNLLSGLKAYKSIVLVFFLGYAVVVTLDYIFRRAGLTGLLLGFDIGHAVLLFGMLFLIYRGNTSRVFAKFEFLSKNKLFRSLIFTGFLYNLGVWADKFVFWFSTDTGQHVIGVLHASVIYDLPIFLAYLSIYPGMAVFLLRMETDFVEHYSNFYDAVRLGGTLTHIQQTRNSMVMAATHGNFRHCQNSSRCRTDHLCTRKTYFKATGNFRSLFTFIKH